MVKREFMEELSCEELVTLIEQAGHVDYIKRRLRATRKHLRFQPMIVDALEQCARDKGVDDTSSFCIKQFNYAELLALASSCHLDDFVTHEYEAMTHYLSQI
jgi:hypothetical protein